MPALEILNSKVTLKMLGRVRFSKRVFRAVGSPGTLIQGQSFAVKFVDTSYSSDLHMLLAKEGYAPVLHSALPLESQYKRIVMDWVKEVPPDDLGDLEISQRQLIARHLNKIIILMK